MAVRDGAARDDRSFRGDVRRQRDPRSRQDHHPQPAHRGHRSRRHGRRRLRRQRLDRGIRSSRPDACRLGIMIPSREAFTPREWRLIQTLNTPRKVQRWLNALPYNTERQRETLRSFRECHADRPRALPGGRAGRGGHSRAARLSAARHEHRVEGLARSRRVLYKERGRWGAIARSRDPGLHGRKPAFCRPARVALSYVEATSTTPGGCAATASPISTRRCPDYDWRFSLKNVWKVEQLLIEWPHRKIKTSDARTAPCSRDTSRSGKRYGRKPWRYYNGRESGCPFPRNFY